MSSRRINIVIAGRTYPLNIPVEDEEMMRKLGKAIEQMIKDYKTNFDIRDTQDALVWCALKLGSDAERAKSKSERNIQVFQKRLEEISQLLEKNEEGDNP